MRPAIAAREAQALGVLDHPRAQLAQLDGHRVQAVALLHPQLGGVGDATRPVGHGHGHCQHRHLVEQAWDEVPTHCGAAQRARLGGEIRDRLAADRPLVGQRDPRAHRP
jgi:hypothetical protein